MSYLVLARKFRPQRFEDLVGQEHVTQTLVNALASKRLAHAYVFAGPRGCGKTTTARILAKALNCVQGPTATPCGTCPQCRDIASGSSTDDVLEIDGASNRGIDQIRELRETVKYAPARSRYRVIIIDEAHQISKDGFNALLKTLEEPPPHVVFMMATTESQKIPETILSRCQRFQLKSISPASIAAQLEKIAKADGLNVQKDALEEVARAAHGSLRDALSLLDQVIAYAPNGGSAEDVRRLLGLLPRELVRDFMTVLRGGSPTAVLASVDRAVADGFDLGQLSEALLAHYHDLLLAAAGARDPQAPDAAALKEEAGLYTVPQLEQDLGVIARATSELRRSEAPRVTFELACLELAQRLTPVDEILERLERLEALLQGGGAALAAAPVRAPAPEPAAPRPAPLSRAIDPAPLPSTPPPPVSPASPPAPAGSVTDAWTRMLVEMDIKKPSLASFLRNARVRLSPGGELDIVCAQEFQRQQIAAQESLWLPLLRTQAGKTVAARVIFAEEKPSVPPPASLPRTPAPAPVEDAEEVEADSEEEGPAPAEPTVVQVGDEDAKSLAQADQGLKKILDKFPGQLRRSGPSD